MLGSTSFEKALVESLCEEKLVDLFWRLIPEAWVVLALLVGSNNLYVLFIGLHPPPFAFSDFLYQFSKIFFLFSFSQIFKIFLSSRWLEDIVTISWLCSLSIYSCMCTSRRASEWHPIIWTAKSSKLIYIFFNTLNVVLLFPILFFLKYVK